MRGMWEFAILLLLVGAMVLLIGPRLRGRGMRGADMVQGTMLITGVSPRPDATGEQWVTVSGVISGPTVREHVVYQQYATDVQNWPSMGDLVPVMYSAKNPDKWAFGAPEPVMPPVPDFPPPPDLPNHPDFNNPRDFPPPPDLPNQPDFKNPPDFPPPAMPPDLPNPPDPRK